MSPSNPFALPVAESRLGVLDGCHRGRRLLLGMRVFVTVATSIILPTALANSAIRQTWHGLALIPWTRKTLST